METFAYLHFRFYFILVRAKLFSDYASLQSAILHSQQINKSPAFEPKILLSSFSKSLRVHFSFLTQGKELFFYRPRINSNILFPANPVFIDPLYCLFLTYLPTYQHPFCFATPKSQILNF